MVHYDGSHVQSNTTNAATLVRTQFRTTIPSHPNWTFVESTTMNAGAFPCDVYKCSSAGSGLGADFYVAIMQNGVNLYLSIAEGYNTSTHKPQRPAVKASSLLQPLQADGGLLPATTEIDWYNGTYNPGGGSLTAWPQTAPQMYSAQLIDDWKIMVGADCVYFMARSTPSYGYAGPYDSLVPTPATNDPLPLLVTAGIIGTSSIGHTQALRHPMCGGASIGYATNCIGNGASETSSQVINNPWAGPFPMGIIASGATADNSDLYAGGLVTNVSRYVVLNSYINVSSTVGRDKNGWVRGFYRRMRQVNSIIGGVTWGDQITIDGIAYSFHAAALCFETNPA